MNVFDPIHRDEVHEMYLATLRSSQTRAQNRQQGVGDDAKVVLGSFDAADNYWKKAVVSSRAPVVGGGRVANGQEGKMFESNHAQA